MRSMSKKGSNTVIFKESQSSSKMGLGNNFDKDRGPIFCHSLYRWNSILRNNKYKTVAL